MVLSQEADKWSVKFDFRDFGEHLDTTFRGWSSTLATRVRLVISRLVLIFALSLELYGRIRVVRSMYLPAALHGIEASLLASDSLRKLRSSLFRVVWSRRQLLASIGAVLSLLDGHAGCDPAFCVVWFRFRLPRRYLALWPAEVGEVHCLLEMVGEGCSGHGPIHLLSTSAAEIGFRWDPLALACLGLVYSFLVTWLVLFSISRLLSLMLGVTRFLLTFVSVRVFVVGPFWMFMVLCNSLLLLLLGRGGGGFGSASQLLVGGVWNGFLLGRVRNQAVPCRFCGAPDHDGRLFWECTFLPLVEIRENPEFHDLMRMDKAHWPRCLLWHGWLPMLSGVNGVSPWAGTASECANYLVEAVLGDYSSRMVSDWSPPDGYDQVAVSCIVPDYPNVWTDGSLVLDSITGVSSSGAGFFARQPASYWDHRRWGRVDQVRSVGDLSSCHGFCSVPGPLQSVQRAEVWGVTLELQSSVLFILVLTIWVSFVTLVGCLMIGVVLLLLNLSRMVIFFYYLRGCFN